jgi:hypothetical protein
VEKEKRERVKTFRSSKEIFLNYTEDSTIQGLIYVFFPYQVMNVTQTINISGQGGQIFLSAGRLKDLSGLWPHVHSKNV